MLINEGVQSIYIFESFVGSPEGVVNSQKITMTKKVFTILLFAFVIGGINTAFAVAAHVCGAVASQVDESSGLDFSGGSSFWTHNDGYGDNRIYKIGMTGTCSKTITVTNAVNNDWEDITHDEARTKMFIGDFGNNNDNRTNLRIWIIPYPSTISGTTTTATSIKFSYPDQRRFPSKWLNFDVEGFFHFNGKLYLFTKADGNAIGYTKLYTLPDAPGTYVATLVDSFATTQRITSAAISPNGTTVALLSNTKIFLFRNWTGRNIFSGNVTKLAIDGGWTQKEGITFFDDETVYITDEGGSNKLYSVNLSSYIPRLAAPQVQTETAVDEVTLALYPNPATSYTNIRSSIPFEKLNVIITDLSGKVVKEFSYENTSDIRIETDDLANGMYAVVLLGDNRKNSLQLNVAK